MQPPLKFVPGLTEIFFFPRSILLVKNHSVDEAHGVNGMAVCFGGCLNKNLPKIVTRPVSPVLQEHTALRMGLDAQMAHMCPGESSVPHLPTL